MSLVTLASYKLAIGETDASKDSYHQLALDAASDAVLHYSDRDFGAAAVTENRTYSYNGSGVLNIDEFSVVHTVTFATGSPLLTSAWRAKTDGPAGVPYSWLELPVIAWGDSLGSLGAMGFEQNLDRFISTGAFPEIQVTVNADWGWATVPADVQRAVIWTAKSYEDSEPSSGAAGGLASKSVAEVAESYFQEQMQQIGSQNPPALPDRARAIIDAYRRISL